MNNDHNPMPAESCLATSRNPLSRYTYLPKTVGVAETHDRKNSLASQVSGTPQEPQNSTRRTRVANEERGETVHGTETSLATTNIYRLRCMLFLFCGAKLFLPPWMACVNLTGIGFRPFAVALTR